jgi:DNA polymerase/3'-5' exonuclease PolX
MVAPLCLRCEIAGSIRRRLPDCGDMELVSIPNPAHFSKLQDLVNNSNWGKPEIGAFPSKYTRLRTNVVLGIDLFWCSKETFGLNYFIRTGPKEFVTRALAHWKKITKGGFSDEAKLWKPEGAGFAHHPTPEESDVFAALGCKFVEPEKRLSQRISPKRPGS